MVDSPSLEGLKEIRWLLVKDGSAVDFLLLQGTEFDDPINEIQLYISVIP